MHKNGLGHTREEIVRQVWSINSIIKNFAEYIPIKNAVEKIQKWEKQGYKIIYFSSRRKIEQLNDIRGVLKSIISLPENWNTEKMMRHTKMQVNELFPIY